MQFGATGGQEAETTTELPAISKQNKKFMIPWAVTEKVVAAIGLPHLPKPIYLPTIRPSQKV